MPERSHIEIEKKSPSKIFFSNWKSVFLQVKDRNDVHNLTIVSAGIAYYAFLAIFPAIIAFVSIYGLVMDPQQIGEQISQLSAMMPQEAFALLQNRIKDFVSTSEQALGWGVALSILFSIWSANSGTKSLFIGLDIAYNTGKKRGFIKQNGLSLLFTFGAMVFGILSIAFIVAYPALID
ncbi:MAG TPA: YihY/virulence factor BrkB family protein, partial [Salinimicrobium sp.]|nr:YihY/virulence factor BrkB family protein [Salinimicrobium sp.]